MKYADIIIPHGRSNTVAIDFVLQNLKTRVNLKDYHDPKSPSIVESPTHGAKHQDPDTRIEVILPSDNTSKV